MKGSYVLQKPPSRQDLVVLDVNFGRPGCADNWGWDMWISNDYSAYLRNRISEDEFSAFVVEANKAMEKSKLKSGGLLCNTLCLLTCCIGGICVKNSVDKATSKAVSALDGVVKKWNNKFIADGRMISMRTKHLHRSLQRQDFKANGTAGAAVDNMNRLTELDDEVWIEIEINTSS